MSKVVRKDVELKIANVHGLLGPGSGKENKKVLFDKFIIQETIYSQVHTDRQGSSLTKTTLQQVEAANGIYHLCNYLEQLISV